MIQLFIENLEMDKEATTTYFNHLTDLLNLERLEDARLFEQAMASGTVQQQAEMGLCWFPLRIVDTGFGFGDYPFVIAERTRFKGSPHQLGPGKPVKIFSLETDESESVQGVIERVMGDQIRVVFFRDELPDVLDFGKVGIQLLFDEQSYKITFDSLKLVANAKNCRLAEIRDVLTGIHKAEKSPSPFEFSPSLALNDSQNDAVKLIVENEDVCIVHGPPGTGKTTTLVEAARQLAQQDCKILIATPSNAAADHISLQLIKAGIRIIRAGNPVRISAELESRTPEGILRESPDYSVIKESRKRADEFRRMANKYKRNFGSEERNQRRLLLQEARELTRDAVKMEKMLVDSAFRNAEVVTCTLVGASTAIPQDLEFDFVFIDEAAQAPEPQCWIPIIKAHRLVMAGDPFQLPPTVKSEVAAKGGLGITLMEKCMQKLPVRLLNVQYRMNPAIMAFPNKWFYNNELQAFPSLENQYMEGDSGISFIDTAGLGWEEILNQDSRSFTNPEEVRFVFEQLKILDAELFGSRIYSVAVISPYSQQIRLFNEEAPNYFPDPPAHLNLHIQTIDAFQGQERDIVFVSLVRSNDRQEIGFLKDYRRMNVAMTRARYKLVVIGDSACLSKDPFYDKLITWCMNEGFYRSAWEFIS